MARGWADRRGVLRPGAARQRLFAAGTLVVAGAAAVLGFAAGCRDGAPEPEAVRPAIAVGDATCLGCHQDKASYEATAHRRTSALPTARTIAGSFRDGENVVRTADPGIFYRLHADAAGFHQTAVVAHGADTTRRTERIAYVVGSGRRGQSYAYWAGDRLYQLPISYWTNLGRWTMSPGAGYGDGPPNFERGMAPRCLECHATWFEGLPELGVVNRFRPAGAMLGVTCERCHAAGREHVARERSVLHALRAPAVVNPARLTRDRQVEACAQCHGGLRPPVAPAFTYVAGQPLDAYFASLPSTDGAVDVHGNQVALLARSRCYQASQMSCQTCHDVHATRRDPVALSGRCVTCHTEQRCGLYPTRGRALLGRCVDCHMPVQLSQSVVSASGGQAARIPIRSHWIRVYPGTGGH